MTPFTLTVAGSSGLDTDFETELAAAVSGTIEREGAELGAAQLAADALQFIVHNKDAMLAGIMIVDKLIDLATKFKAKLWVTQGGRSVPVDAEHRDAAAAVIDGSGGGV